MRTITICPNGGQPEIELSRNQFGAIRGHPSKGAIRNWEVLLGRYLADYRNDTPSRDFPLTPYQQWVLLQIHEVSQGWPPKTRLLQIKTWIQENKEKIRKTVYEKQQEDKSNESR